MIKILPSAIHDIIVVVVLVIVAAMVATFFLNSAFPPICSFTSFFRDLYHKLCINVAGVELICLSDVVSYEVPLLGCKPVSRDLGSSSPEQFSRQLALQAQSCWTQYGSGKWNVMWSEGDNPGMCSHLSANLEENLNAKVISETWSNMTYAVAYDCTSCENPCNPGYECDLSDKTQCMKVESNMIYCETNGTLPKCSSGQIKVQEIDSRYLSDNEFKDKLSLLVANMSSFVCSGNSFHVESACCGSEGQYSSSSEGECSSGQQFRNHTCLEPDGEGDYKCTNELIFPEKLNLPGDMCREIDLEGERKIKCVYCQHEGEAYKPQECVLTHNVENKECLKEISFSELLQPGLKTLYSFKSQENGERLILGAIEGNFNISGRVHAFVEYIDSFTGAGKSSGIRVLPAECSASFFVETCDFCEDECGSALFGSLIFVYGVQTIKGITTPAGIGVAYHWAPTATGYVGSALLGYGFGILDRITTCTNCLHQKTREWSINPEIVACSDKMLICMYEE